MYFAQHQMPAARACSRFATPDLTMNRLALRRLALRMAPIPCAVRLSFRADANLQKIYGFNEPFRFTGPNRPVAVTFIRSSIRKTRLVIL